MNEKQAREDSQLEIFEHNKCAIAEAKCYLEAIEKANPLLEAIEAIQTMTKSIKIEAWCAGALAQWEEEK